MKNQNFSKYDLKPSYYDHQTIKENVFVCENGQCFPNMSTIFTKLIQEAGRWCVRFASDILIDIDSVRCFIENWDTTEREHRFVFGFRENGVDHESFVERRYRENSIYASLEYRAIWVIDVIKNDEKRSLEITLFQAEK